MVSVAVARGYSCRCQPYVLPAGRIDPLDQPQRRVHRKKVVPVDDDGRVGRVDLKVAGKVSIVARRERQGMSGTRIMQVGGDLPVAGRRSDGHGSGATTPCSPRSPSSKRAVSASLNSSNVMLPPKAEKALPDSFS